MSSYQPNSYSDGNNNNTPPDHHNKNKTPTIIQGNNDNNTGSGTSSNKRLRQQQQQLPEQIPTLIDPKQDQEWELSLRAWEILTSPSSSSTTVDDVGTTIQLQQQQRSSPIAHHVVNMIESPSIIIPSPQSITSSNHPQSITNNTPTSILSVSDSSPPNSQQSNSQSQQQQEEEQQQPSSSPTHRSPSTLLLLTRPDQGENGFRIGDRVCRGPDWKWGNQDGVGIGGTGLGTITRAINGQGIVRVRWDFDGRVNLYRCGCEHGKMDLIKVNDLPDLNLRVERAPDWEYALQDGGGSKGSIVGQRPGGHDGWISVTWDAYPTDVYNYRWGFCGALDVQICPLDWPPESGCGLPIGSRVVRGDDWEWGEQDGIDKLGTVEKYSSTRGWYCVKWDSGHTNQYRYMTDGGKKDIKLYVVNSSLELGGTITAAAATTSAAAAADSRSDIVSLLQHNTSLSPLPILPRGTIVSRNPTTWCWDNQDGGEGNLGTVQGKAEKDGWIRVRWNKSGYFNEYRWNNSIQDIIVISSSLASLTVIGASSLSQGSSSSNNNVNTLQHSNSLLLLQKSNSIISQQSSGGGESLGGSLLLQASPGGSCYSYSSTSAMAAVGGTTTTPTPDDNLCLGCCDQRRNCVILPCAHLALCSDCCDALKNRVCPICRSGIEQTIRVFHV
jgi:hypothetical protein